MFRPVRQCRIQGSKENEEDRCDIKDELRVYRIRHLMLKCYGMVYGTFNERIIFNATEWGMRMR